MPGQRATAYRFREFVLIPAEKRLLLRGNPVSLPPKVFDTLVLLIENSGHLVEKDDFLKRLWPETFVEEIVLANTISQLRKVLQSGSSDKYIETVPKRGYRFLAGVQEFSTSADGQATSIVSESSQETATPVMARATYPQGLRSDGGKRQWMKSLILVAVSCLALAVGISAIYLHKQATNFGRDRIRSLAVLPLQDLSGIPGQEYLSDGITDEMITALAHMKDVRVISRTSTMQYKNTQKSLPQIARDLNVDAVVEGTFVRSNGRVRIRAQLIRADTDEHIWAEAYERDIGDVLDLENQVAKDIATAIRSQIPNSEGTTKQSNPEAHELYLKGRYLWNKRDKKSLDHAVEYFKEAIAKQPNYAEPYSGVADCYILMGGYNYMPFPESLAKAKAAAEMALSLNEGLAEAHTSLGLIETFDHWNWTMAKRHFERALELNPNYATAHHWYGDGYLAPMGRVEDALVELRKAHELDPLSPIIATDIGKELYMARRYDEAIVQLRRVLELEPQFDPAHGWLADSLVEKGLYNEAREELQAIHVNSGTEVSICNRAYVLARSGNQIGARRLLSNGGPDSRHSDLNPGCVAMIYAALGEKDQAFLWLEKAYVSNTSYMTSLKIWPQYDPLRADPRFSDLQRRVGLQ